MDEDMGYAEHTLLQAIKKRIISICDSCGEAMAYVPQKLTLCNECRHARDRGKKQVYRNKNRNRINKRKRDKAFADMIFKLEEE